MIASALDVGEAAIMSAVVGSTIHLVTAQRFSTLVGAQRAPSSSQQALRRRRDSLRVDVYGEHILIKRRVLSVKC